MKPIECAAVDLGATSGRVIVGSWSDNRLTLTEVRRFTNQFRSLGGRDYWDLPYLWSEVSAGLKEAKIRFPRLASVGVDTWAVDHVLVNAKGRMVYPVHAYRDNRTEKSSKALARKGLVEVYQWTGIPNYPYNTSLQLQETLRECPAMAEAASKCLFIPDYINYLLSGKKVNELSIASHAQLLDVASNRWSEKALSYFGVPRGWFSQPTPSPKKLGPVINFPELAEVVSILVPGHDTACAFAAMPAAADGADLYLSSGTWSLLGFESAAPILGKDALAARISNERMGGGKYRPLRSCLGLWLLEQTLADLKATPKNDREWQRLIKSASALKAPRLLIDVTDSELFHPVSMRAAIDQQLTKKRALPPRDAVEYVRLICDSLGRGHADAVREFERLSKRKFKRILIVGGGSKNPLLCQATANTSNLPVISFELEGTAVGNLAHQLIALGAVEDLPTFRRHLANNLKQTVYQPQS